MSGKLLLFSGVKGDGSAPLQDMWSWDGRRWTQLHPPDSPPGRSFGNLAFDENTQQTILFGGGSPNSDPFKQDTWSWDGVAWALLHPSSSPGAAVEASVVYDAASQSVVLFGPGGDQLNSPQTWVWNGATWLNRSSTLTPSGRSQTAMAYDANHRLVVLFGGYVGGPGPDDTWVWDGSQWQQLRPPANPPGGPAFAAYDAVHQQVVLFVQGQTSIWDGSS